MYRRMNTKGKALLEFYREKPEVAQGYWHCIRSFAEGCGYFAEEMHAHLMFTSRDPRLQALTGKLYNDWVHERYLEGLPADDYDQFVKDVLEKAVKKMITDFKLDLVGWLSAQK